MKGAEPGGESMRARDPALGNTSRAQYCNRLAAEAFDVLVIGGGIGGACTAWDAALRGLRVALVERTDFGAATSAQSLKFLHGGIRYLQHLDLVRLRESCRERGAFLRIAPHLTRPLPVAVPTYGHGIQSRWLFGAALTLLELLTCDRNRATRDAQRRVPRSYLLDRSQLLQHFAAVEQAELTGAGVFFDGQIINPPRAVLAVTRAAAHAGAVVANYCEARDLVVRNGHVVAVRVRDLLRGDEFEVRARVTVNATGPFAPSLAKVLGGQMRLDVPLSRDMAFVVRRALDPDLAVAVQTRYRDPDAVLSRGNRHLFLAPWCERYTLIGVNSRVYTDDAYDLQVTEQEIAAFLDEINAACPPLRLQRADIAVVNAGLLPFGDNEPGRKDLSFGKRSLVVDHAANGGPAGLLSAMAVRWTMGRLLGERVINLVESKLGRKPLPSATAWTPVWGGAIESVADCARAIRRGLPQSVSDAQAARIFRHYGSDWQEIARQLQPQAVIPGSDCFAAEVLHAVRAELAATLTDVVMRRLDLGSAQCPAEPTLRACAAIVGDELGWNGARREREMDAVRASYPFANPRSQLPVTVA